MHHDANTTAMKLYDTLRSGNAWKVRLLAALLGRPLQRVTLSIDRGELRSAAFRRIAPLGQVPVLELDDGRTLAESMAILQWLARGTPWWPDDAWAQAEVLAWLSFEQSQHMHPLAQLRLRIALHRRHAPGDPALQGLHDQAVHALDRLEERLRSQAGGWLVGDRPTIADVALYPYTRMAPLGGIDLGARPAILAWLARIEALPGYESLFPGEPGSHLRTTESEETP